VIAALQPERAEYARDSVGQRLELGVAQPPVAADDCRMCWLRGSMQAQVEAPGTVVVHVDS